MERSFVSGRTFDKHVFEIESFIPDRGATRRFAIWFLDFADQLNSLVTVAG